MEWQPIETAPDGKLVIVGWLDDDDSDNPERHDFDYKEDGVWYRHDENVQYADSCAPPGSKMPSQNAPYTHYMQIPPLPPPPTGEPKSSQDDIARGVEALGIL